MLRQFFCLFSYEQPSLSVYLPTNSRMNRNSVSSILASCSRQPSLTFRNLPCRCIRTTLRYQPLSKTVGPHLKCAAFILYRQHNIRSLLRLSCVPPACPNRHAALFALSKISAFTLHAKQPFRKTKRSCFLSFSQNPRLRCLHSWPIPSVFSFLFVSIHFRNDIFHSSVVKMANGNGQRIGRIVILRTTARQ